MNLGQLGFGCEVITEKPTQKVGNSHNTIIVSSSHDNDDKIEDTDSKTDLDSRWWIVLDIPVSRHIFSIYLCLLISY